MDYLFDIEMYANLLINIQVIIHSILFTVEHARLLFNIF